MRPYLLAADDEIMIKTILAIFSFSTLAGCAVNYIQPGPDSEHATLNLMQSDFKSEMKLLSSADATQSFHAYDNDKCIKNSPALLGVPYKKNIVSRVIPNKRIYIRSATTIFRSGSQIGISKNKSPTNVTSSNKITPNLCFNLTSFIPENGKSYSIQQYSEQCSTDIIDINTQAPPLSFERHEVKGLCGR